MKHSRPEWESLFVSAIRVDLNKLSGDARVAERLCKWVNEGDESGWHDFVFQLFGNDSPTLALKQVNMILVSFLKTHATARVLCFASLRTCFIRLLYFPCS